jgi:hypothetical protein
MLTKFAELTILSALLRFQRLTRLTRLTIAISRLTGGMGGSQKSCSAFAPEPRGSHAQIFFLQPKLLKSIKRNQINQTIGFKGVVRSQADEIADLISAARGRGGSKVWRVESRDRRRRFVRKIVKLNTKSPPGGRVKTLDRFVRDRRASDTNFFAQLAKRFFGPAIPPGRSKICREIHEGGGGVVGCLGR